jgi:hypothetical protein
MKISEENNGIYFFIEENKKVNVFYYDNGAIELYEEEDPTHTGHYFENINSFFLYINNITEIARKLKEERCQQQ